MSLEETMASENEWVRVEQELKHGDHYQHLVTRFGLEMDDDGILRCKGH